MRRVSSLAQHCHVDWTIIFISIEIPSQMRSWDEHTMVGTINYQSIDTMSEFRLGIKTHINIPLNNFILIRLSDFPTLDSCGGFSLRHDCYGSLQIYLSVNESSALEREKRLLYRMFHVISMIPKSPMIPKGSGRENVRLWHRRGSHVCGVTPRFVSLGFNYLLRWVASIRLEMQWSDNRENRAYSPEIITSVSLLLPKMRKSPVPYFYTLSHNLCLIPTSHFI